MPKSSSKCTAVVSEKEVSQTPAEIGPQCVFLSMKT